MHVIFSAGKLTTFVSDSSFKVTFLTFFRGNNYFISSSVSSQHFV
jgi:hypothetical protein